ncbi:MAG: rubrerythrin family protein [Thermoleophilia bacterium]
MGDTLGNLKDAFAGESQANRRYLAYAKKAEEEGYPLVARRFRVAAESETIHAHNHLRVMGGLKSTAENLRASIGGENYEHVTMYPDFIAQAEKEGNEEAKYSFHAANEAEKFHEKMFAEALEKMEALGDSRFYVCQVCGMTYENEVPEHCVVCTAPKEKILEVA